RQGPSAGVGGFRAVGQPPGVTWSALEMRPGGRLLRDRPARQEHERCGRDRRRGGETDGAPRSVTAHREQVGSPLTGAHMLAAAPPPRLDAPRAAGGSARDRHEPYQILYAERGPEQEGG